MHRFIYHISTLFLLLSVMGAGNAQIVKPDYQIWRNKGSFSSKTFYEEKKAKNKWLLASNKTAYDYLMYTYYNHYRMLDQSFKTGYFIGNTEMNDYLENIVSEIQNKNKNHVPSSRLFKVLIVRSSEPNAFAFGDGILGVSIGLLATLDKEEELISILCHEISHDILNHNEQTSLKLAYMHTDGSIGDSIDFILAEEDYNRTRMEAYLSKIYSSSMNKNRQNELQADSLGLILLSNVGNGKTDAVNALKKLNRTLLDHKEYSIFKYFEDLNLNYSKTWVYNGDQSRLKDLVNTDVFFMDTISSHPREQDRLNRLHAIDSMEKLSPAGRIVSDYYQIKFNSLVQLSLMNYEDGDPALTVYYALVLKQFEPKQLTSDYLILIGLCKSSFLKQELKLTQAIGATDSSYEWSYNQVIYLMQKMKQSELKEFVCSWYEALENKNSSELYAYTALLYTSYFCTKVDKYNYLRTKYKELYKEAFFKNDLIYLPKKSNK